MGVEVKFGTTRSVGTAKDALTKLFAIKEQNYGESGLYNALYQSELKIDSLTVDNKKATLKLSGEYKLGGVCDNPRFGEQIKETVLQFRDIFSDVDVFINNTPLEEILSEK